MKKILMLTVVLIIFVGTLFAQIASIKWNTNLDYAKKLATTKNLPIVLFFMDEPAGTLSNSVYNNTLSNNLLIDKINNNFIPMIVKGDTVLQREYDIQRIPTLLILTKNNVEMDRLAGVIGIDQAFAMLENAQMNHESQLATASSATTEDSATTTTIATTEFQYVMGKGTFIKQDEENWIHKTSFYTVPYTQTKEDKRHYYIVSKDRTVRAAIPKTAGTPIWVVEGTGKWVSKEDISTITTTETEEE